MDTFLDILKTTLPALVVFLTVWFVIKEFMTREYQIRTNDLRRKVSATVLPLRLQAYERMALYLERLSIPKLLIRLHSGAADAQSLHSAIIVTVEQEYDHNMSQQIYMTPELWQFVQLAKTEVVNISSKVIEKVGPTASADTFYDALLDYLRENPAQARQQALLMIKKEVQLMF